MPATLFGAAAPEAGDGSDGDFYIDTTLLDRLVLHYYGPKAAGAWPTTRVVVAHSQIVSGPGVPDAHYGQIGSVYRSNSVSGTGFTGALYGPKAADASFATGAPTPGTLQVETLTVLGTIGASGVGNAVATLISAGLPGSPITVMFAVANDDTATLVAGKLRTALGLVAAIAARFTISGSGADVILTQKAPALDNDTTLLLSLTNGTCSGLTPATSANTTAGIAAGL